MADEVDDEVQSEPEEAAAEVEEEEEGEGEGDGGAPADQPPEPDLPVNVRSVPMIRAHLRIGSAFKIFDHDDNNQVDARCVC